MIHNVWYIWVIFIRTYLFIFFIFKTQRFNFGSPAVELVAHQPGLFSGLLIGLGFKTLPHIAQFYRIENGYPISSCPSWPWAFGPLSNSPTWCSWLPLISLRMFLNWTCGTQTLMHKIYKVFCKIFWMSPTGGLKWKWRYLSLHLGPNYEKQKKIDQKLKCGNYGLNIFYVPIASFLHVSISWPRIY